MTYTSLVQATLIKFQGESSRRPTGISLIRTHTKHTQNMRDWSITQYHTQLAKMTFGEIFDLTAGVYYSYNA